VGGLTGLNQRKADRTEILGPHPPDHLICRFEQVHAIAIRDTRYIKLLLLMAEIRLLNCSYGPHGNQRYDSRCLLSLQMPTQAGPLPRADSPGLQLGQRGSYDLTWLDYAYHEIMICCFPCVRTAEQKLTLFDQVACVLRDAALYAVATTPVAPSRHQDCTFRITYV